MYADDICLLALSALGLQKLLDVCYNFNQCNDIVFNSLKSVYMRPGATKGTLRRENENSFFDVLCLITFYWSF